jgi:signal transduction histidine kinase
MRVAVVPVSTDPVLGFAAVAEPLNVLDEGLGQLRRDFFAGVPLVLLLASLGGYLLARKSLAPIAAMVSEQQRFIADASHELRTPLAVLRGET